MKTPVKTSASKTTKKMVLSALFLALGLLLPLLAGHMPQLGRALLPMHIPVLLCGFVCGWPWGLLVGLLTPLLNSVAFGMPPLFPTALSMAFELAAYGFFTGLLYKLLPKKPVFVYASLLASMLFGRFVWGISQLLLLGVSTGGFTWALFISGAFVNAALGIAFQIIVIPILILALNRARLMEND